MKIGLIGGGGFAKEIAEIAEIRGYEVSGYFADTPSTTKWPYLGTPEDAYHFNAQMSFAFAIGAVNSQTLMRRKIIIESLKSKNVKFETLTSPNAIISAGVRLGEGVFVAHGVVISVDALIGDFTIINSGAVIGHDAKIGAYNVLAPLCFIGGNAELLENVLVGPQATILEGRQIGHRCVIGTGAVVHRHIKAESIIMPIVSKTIKS